MSGVTAGGDHDTTTSRREASRKLSLPRTEVAVEKTSIPNGWPYGFLEAGKAHAKGFGRAALEPGPPQRRCCPALL